MSNKKEPPFDPDFDPTVPEEGVVVPEDTDMGELFDRHLPSEADIAIAARGAFGNILPEDMIHDLVCSSNEINGSIRRIMHEHLSLGFQFGEIMRRVHSAYVASFGDSQRTSRRAKDDAFAYIEKLHRVSNSKVRMHLRAYAKFHSNTEAVEYLRQTDMQLLLAKDLGDDIVNAVIEKRKANPETSTREVKALIAALRQVKDELAATQEEVESVNNERSRLITLYDVSKEEERRLKREMEKMQLQRAETQEATDRMHIELARLGALRNALHQQLSETERERDAARREVSEMRKRPPNWDDAKLRADVRRLNDAFGRQLAKYVQLDEQISARKAELAAMSAKLPEAEAGRESRSRIDEQMNALVADFCGLAQRYQSARLLCTAEDNRERFEHVLDSLVDVVGKFYMDIVASRKAASRSTPGTRAHVMDGTSPRTEKPK